MAVNYHGYQPAPAPLQHHAPGMIGTSMQTLWPPNMPLPLNYRLQYLHQKLLLHHHRLQVVIASSKTDALGTACKDGDHDDAVSTAAGSTTDSETASLQHAIDRALVDALVASLTSKRSGLESGIEKTSLTAARSEATRRNSIVLSDILPEPARASTSGNASQQVHVPGPVLSTLPCRVAAHTESIEGCREELAVIGQSHNLAAEGDTISNFKVAGQTEASSAETGTQGSSRSEAPSICTDIQVRSIDSDGSALHYQGRCKPCAFVHREGCKSDASCKFCHLCPEGEKKRRLKERKKPQAHVWGFVPNNL